MSVTVISLALLVFLRQICPIIPCNVETVTTDSGTIRGRSFTTSDGREVCCFLGVPFAKPPVGNFRFHRPLPVEPWRDVLDATKNPPSCVEEEDCLYINICTPKSPANGEAPKFPVLFYIHGGQWFSGDININVYGPQFLLNKDVVFVSVNYRLGALGFLSTGDGVVPGNWGIKDMVLAVKWVHTNIKYFGGDNTKITTMGQSRGSTSAQLLFYIPELQGLIKQALGISFTIYDPYSIGPLRNVTIPSRKLAELVECPSSPSTELLKCMRTVPFEKLIAREFDVYPNDVLVGANTIWAPVIECKSAKYRVISHDLTQRTCQPSFPWISGVNQYDGAIFVSFLFGSGPEFEKRLQDEPETILPLALQLDLVFCQKDIPHIIDEVIEFYFGNRPVGRSTQKELVTLFTDWFFHVGFRRALLEHNGTVYVFRNTITQSVSHKDVYPGNVPFEPTHMDWLLNFFPDPAEFPNRTYSETDKKNIKKVVDYIYCFAKHGHPSCGTSTKWEPVGNDGKVKYLLMENQEDVLEDDFDTPGLKLFDRLMKKYRTKTLTDYTC